MEHVGHHTQLYVSQCRWGMNAMDVRHPEGPTFSYNADGRSASEGEQVSEHGEESMTEGMDWLENRTAPLSEEGREGTPPLPVTAGLEERLAFPHFLPSETPYTKLSKL